MNINEVDFDGARPVRGYGPGFFRIGGEIRQGAVLVTPEGDWPWGGYDDHAALLAQAHALDVLFVGTGAQIAPIPAALRSALEEAGLGVEIMASPAACRSYNVLLSEGRRIGAALLPVT